MYWLNVLLVHRHSQGASHDCVSPSTLRVERPQSKDESRQAVVKLLINSEVRPYKSCKELAIATKSSGLYAVASLLFSWHKSFIRQQVHWSSCATYFYDDSGATLPKKNPNFKKFKILWTLLHFKWLTWRPGGKAPSTLFEEFVITDKSTWTSARSL